MASSSENISPLAAMAPLHDLAQLVPIPSESPKANPSSASKEQGRNRAYILLTSLKPDAWFVYLGHPDGRWWNGAWRGADIEDLARGDISSARVSAFAQRVARTIIQGEIGIASEGDDFGNMKLVLGTKAKKPLRLALSELDRETVARFAFEYFVRVAEDAKAHGCRIFHGNIAHTDSDHTDHLAQGVSPPPLKRRRTQTSNASPTQSLDVSSTSQRSHRTRNAGSLRQDNDKETDLPGTSRGGPRRSYDRPPVTQAQTQAERAARLEVQELKAELAKARADTAAAVALAADREPSGLGGSVDRLRSRMAVPAMPRRPGASLANPNKAARRVTAVEFASDSDGE